MSGTTVFPHDAWQKELGRQCYTEFGNAFATQRAAFSVQRTNGQMVWMRGLVPKTWAAVESNESTLDTEWRCW